MSTNSVGTSLVPRPSEPITYPEPLLPYELWHYILSFLEADSNTEGLRHLSACSMASRGFLAFCLDQCVAFRTHYVFNHIPLPLSDFEPTPLSPEITLHERQTLLAVDSKGRHYSRSEWGLYQSDLFILDSSNKGFGLIHLDLSKIIHTEGKVELKFAEGIKKDSNLYDIAQRIVACHPTEDGFIVVTKAGVSIWKYQDEKPEFQHFISPFPQYEVSQTEILYSAYQDPILCLQTNVFSGLAYMINMETNEIFECLDGTGLSVTRCLTNAGDRLGFVWSPASQLIYYQTVAIVDVPQKEGIDQKKIPSSYLDIEEGEFRLWKATRQKKIVLVGEPTTFASGSGISSIGGTQNWLILMDNPITKAGTITILNSDQTVHIGRETGLKLPKSTDNGHIFIRDDFLFLIYNNDDFKIIHLPSKKDYSQKLRPFLEPYLKDLAISLFSLAIRTDIETNALVVDVLLQREKYSKTAAAGLELSTVSIPLQNAFRVQKSVGKDGNKPKAANPPLETSAPTGLLTSTRPISNRPNVIKPTQKASPPQKTPETLPNTETLASDLPTSKRDIPNKPRLIKPPRSTTSRPVHNRPPTTQSAATSTSRCALTDGKIIIAAGAILLLLTAAGGALLMVLHPGTVLYQGSGIVLTLPAVVTLSVGGSFSLVIIAIGSYRWWKSRQTI